MGSVRVQLHAAKHYQSIVRVPSLNGGGSTDQTGKIDACGVCVCVEKGGRGSGCLAHKTLTWIKIRKLQLYDH